MSGRAKAQLLLGGVFAVVMTPILFHYGQAWRAHPWQAGKWILEVVIMVALGILFAPLLLRAARLLLYLYLAIGGLLARLVLGVLAQCARERGRVANEFESQPVTRSFARWMRYGSDAEFVQQSLLPSNLAGWIVAAWPVVLLPFIFEETAPIMLIVMCLAPFALRQYHRRVKEVHDVTTQALAGNDSQRSAERHFSAS